MSIETQKYIRKPVVVEAVQVTKENFLEIAMWCGGEIVFGADKTQLEDAHIVVNVHSAKTENQKWARVGYWVLYTRIRGKSSYKVYTDRAFKNTFDLDPSEQLKESWQEVKAAGRQAMDDIKTAVDKGMDEQRRKHFRGDSRQHQGTDIPTKEQLDQMYNG